MWNCKEKLHGAKDKTNAMMHYSGQSEESREYGMFK